MSFNFQPDVCLRVNMAAAASGLGSAHVHMGSFRQTANVSRLIGLSFFSNQLIIIRLLLVSTTSNIALVLFLNNLFVAKGSRFRIRFHIFK